jgi:hypothetical protein
MGLAGAAEVLTTGTVRDLVSGSGATFEDRGIQELKGIDGSWPVVALQAVEIPLPSPLSREEATTRLARIESTAGARMRRRLLIAAAAVVLVALAIAVPLATTGGGKARAAAPVSLLRLDGRTGRIVALSKIGPAGRDLDGNLRIYDGVLWHLVSERPPTVAIRAQRRRLSRSLCCLATRSGRTTDSARCGCSAAPLPERVFRGHGRWWSASTR